MDKEEGGGSWDSEGEGGGGRSSISIFADHAAKQRGEAHASLISITPCFQRGRRQSNKEGLRGKSHATCKAVASAKIRGSSSNNREKSLSAPGNAPRRQGGKWKPRVPEG